MSGAPLPTLMQWTTCWDGGEALGMWGSHSVPGWGLRWHFGPRGPGLREYEGYGIDLEVGCGWGWLGLSITELTRWSDGTGLFAG